MTIDLSKRELELIANALIEHDTDSVAEWDDWYGPLYERIASYAQTAMYPPCHCGMIGNDII